MIQNMIDISGGGLIKVKQVKMPQIASGATSVNVDIGVKADKLYALMSDAVMQSSPYYHIAYSPIRKLGVYYKSGVDMNFCSCYLDGTILRFIGQEGMGDYFSPFSEKTLNVFYT